MPRTKQLACEHFGRVLCTNPATNFERNAKDAKDWPNPNMPIALCEKHKGKRKRYEKIKLENLIRAILPGRFG